MVSLEDLGEPAGGVVGHFENRAPDQEQIQGAAPSRERTQQDGDPVPLHHAQGEEDQGDAGQGVAERDGQARKPRVLFWTLTTLM